MILADLGADVIKVEAIVRSDDFSATTPHQPGLDSEGAPFFCGNRNKRSVVLDISRAAGELCAISSQAGIVAENFSVDVMEKLRSV